MARGRKPTEDEREDDILRELRSRGNSERGPGSRPIDGGLLSMVVSAVTSKGGQISFGTTKDGSRFVLTLWYKGFPTKDYCESVEEVEQRLAFTLDVFLPKKPEFDDWRTYAGQFK